MVESELAGSSLLYVEDEADVRELVSGMLMKNYPGLRLLVAGDGLCGLELFRESQPEIVLTDIRMPVMDGLQMAAGIRALNPDTFLIAVTAHSDTDQLLHAMDIGFNHFVLKPVDYRKLFAVVDRCRALHAMKQRVMAQEMHIHRLSRVVGESPSSVIITDPQGVITYVNPRFTALTGYGADEVIGRHPIFLKSEVMPAVVYEQLWKNITSGCEWRGELQNRHKNGDLYWEAISVFPLRGETGEVVNFVAVSEDVSGRKKAEAAIGALNSELEARASALEAANRELEAFNYTVAHDLHSPLQWIGGYSRILLKHYGEKLDERYCMYLEEISVGVVRMEQTIEALLNFSKISRDDLQRQLFDLAEVARIIAADLIKSEPARQVNFRIVKEATVSADRHLMFVVVQNLMGNSWKYTSSRPDAVIEFGVIEETGGTTFFVRDNGPGFDQAAADMIFAPFKRLPGGSGFKGLGIGLATVQRVILRHGGKVWVKAVPGDGATFYFTLDGAV